MRSGRLGAARGDVLRLFDGGSVAGLGDGELLGRFADRRDEAAFEGLVARLGPMVLGVCRRMLADPHDVDDAFQATFLVLVRRAGSIRDRDLVGPWLHGVAARVARRARAESSRRKARDRIAVVPEAVEAVEVEPGWPELRALIDEEIDRLPEHHRRAVVLCDVEGLSREEAAIRLGWTLNMVRGRLERARGRLRGQLARRGLAPPGAWSALVASPPIPPPALASSTIRAALASPGGQVGAGLATAPAVALSRGVLRMMMLSKLKLGLAALCSAGFVAAGSGMLAAQGPGDGANPPPSKPAAVAPATQQVQPVQPPSPASPFLPRSAADVAKARIDLAMQRFKAQKTFYDEGRITVDRLADASKALTDAKRDAAASKAGRVEAVREHYALLEWILKREEAELADGRATTADIAYIKSALLDTEFALVKELEAPETKPAGVAAKAGPRPPAEVRPSWDQERAETSRRVLALLRAEVARRLLAEASRLFPGEIDTESFVAASRATMDAERDAARSGVGRRAAIQSQVDRLRSAEQTVDGLIKQGIKTQADGLRVRFGLLEAELALANEEAGSGSHSVTDLERRVSDVERKLDRILNLLDALKR